MTSGKFSTIPIDAIIINREVRQRRELTGLEELAQSIKTIGLINPVVIDAEYNLVAGERRLTACRDILGWTSISAQFTSDCDPEELYLIELEENVQRVDISWQDKCRTVAAYHDKRLALDPSWNASKTARALNVKEATISNDRLVASALESGDPLIAGADKYSVALGIAQRKLARKRKAKALFTAALQNKIETAPEISETQLDVGEIPPAEEIHVPFLNADFTEYVENYSGPKFNFLHCDFPYGIDAGGHNQGAGSAFGTYDDGEEVYWYLLDTLAAAMRNVVDQSAHMIFWFSMDFYQLTLERLTSMGWKVNPFPLLWHKSDNSGILPDPRRGPRRSYETAFLCSRGDRLIIQAVANLYAAPNLKTIHMSEKNPDMLRHFFRMVVDENSLVLDPTMGSGNAVRVAEQMGAAHVLGLEKSTEFFDAAKHAYLVVASGS